MEAGLGGSDEASETSSAPGSAGVENDPKDLHPSTIARYRITRLIGQGGMGAVYEAEQEQPRRTVALKIIKPGLASPELLRRFEQETQALGRLQHPGIAQIYEAGTADTGFGPQPYFAMEFIRGRSLVQYAVEQKLTTRTRLEIMALVCDAVQHAHQRGLIHRDLKPGNILVDDSGQPKIVDFGVARLTDLDTQATTQSSVGQLIGTLAYMSPEQALADPLEIDTRTDVYALGVILYELLAGRLPYAISKKVHEALAAIREEDPALLSSVSHDYRGDVETIVAKALEKEKARRYGSAAELAADMRRYLTDDPIMARPPSVRYQLQKFARRHKSLVAGIAAVFVVLVAGIVASTWQAARANQAGRAAVEERDKAVLAEEKARFERDRAAAAEQTATTERDRATAAEQIVTTERDRAVAAETVARRERDAALLEKQRADLQTDTANALNNYLGAGLMGLTLFERSPFPTPRAANLNITVREGLDQSVARIGRQFDTKPLVEAALRESIASAYNSLTAYDEVRKQLERAVELRKKVQGSDHPETISVMRRLGTVLIDLGRYSEGAELWKTVLKALPYGTSQRRLMTDQISRTYAAGRLFRDKEIFLLELLAEDRKKGPRYDLAVQSRIRDLVQLYATWELRPKYAEAEALLEWEPRPKYAEAEALLEEELFRQRRAQGTETIDILRNVNQLATLYSAQGTFRHTESLLAPVIPDALVASVGNGGPLLSELDPAVASGVRLLLDAYKELGKSAQADALREKVRTLPGAASLAARLARNYAEADKDAEAEYFVSSVVESRDEIVRQDSSSAVVQSELASMIHLYANRGKHTQAQQLWRKIIEIRLDAPHRDYTTPFYAPLVEIFQTWGAKDSFEENERILERLLGKEKQVLGANTPPGAVLWSLSQVYWDHAKFDLGEGRPLEAQRNYKKADELIVEIVKVRSQNAREAMIHVGRQAQVRAGLGNYNEAEALFAEVLAYQRRVPIEVSNVPITLFSLGWVRILQKKYSDAEIVLREACSRFELRSEQRYNCESLLGASLVGQKKFMEAEPLLLAGYDGLIQAPVDERSVASATYRLTTSRFSPPDAGAWIVRMYEEWDKPEQAAHWRSKLQAGTIGLRR